MTFPSVSAHRESTFELILLSRASEVGSYRAPKKAERSDEAMEGGKESKLISELHREFEAFKLED